MQISDYIDDIARATGFLSRLRVPSRYFEDHDGSLSRASGMFPLAGLVIAIVPGLVILLLSWLEANSALTILISLMVLILLTGALHEDGLADSLDAFGARRGRDHMLEIMRDSHTGTYGVLALVICFAFRVTALTIILSVTGGWNTFLVVLAVAAASRAAMIWHWDELPPARSDGVAASSGAPADGAKTRALFIGTVLYLASVSVSVGIIPAITSLALLAAVVFQWTAIVGKKLNGHTGDTLGATQQIAETACLLTLALLL